MLTKCTQIGINLSAWLCLYISFSTRLVHFCGYVFHLININQFTERNHPEEYKDDPCRMRQVLNIHIWLDFYEDDMSPWVLSSIHIQQS
jgi:hypothetical protein